MPCARRAVHQLCWPAVKTKRCRRMTDKGNWGTTCLLRGGCCLPNREGCFPPRSLLPFSSFRELAVLEWSSEVVRPALGRLWQGNGKLSSSIHSPTSPLLFLQAVLQTSRSLGILWMPEPSQKQLVKKKSQKKVRDPYSKCERVNIKLGAKRHWVGALQPYAAQPRAVCQSEEYVILQSHTQVLPAFCPSPWPSHSPQEGTYGGSSIFKMEQCGETFSSRHFHAMEGQIGAISWWARCRQPQTPIYIVFPQTIGIPAVWFVWVKHIFFFPYRNYFL